MRKKFILILLSILLMCKYLYSQGFKPPAPGKSVVYFVRTAGFFKATYYFFHQDRFIGEITNKDYIRYECLPGKQLFWAKSENAEFLEADIKEGGTYIIHVDIIFGTGFMQANVGFTPIKYNEKERFNPCKEQILSNAPVKLTEVYIEKTNQEMKKTIDKNLVLYEKKWKNTKNFRYITQDMAIPIEDIK